MKKKTAAFDGAFGGFVVYGLGKKKPFAAKSSIRKKKKPQLNHPDPRKQSRLKPYDLQQN